MAKTLYGRIAHISMSSAEWAKTDTVLKNGELGYDTTNHRMKIGDNAHSWADLPYETEESIDTGLTCADFAV